MELLRVIGGGIVAFTARLLLRLLYRLEVHGTLPAAERMLIVSNHQSFLDGVILGAFLPLSPTYLIHSSVANRWYFKIPLTFIRHVVVDTTSPLAIKTLIQLIEAGRPVVIFPEGRITVTGRLMKIYDGPAFVAARTGCAVVPVHIHGPVYSVFSRMTGDFPLLKFPKMRMTIHPPARVPMPEGRTAKIRRRKAAEELRRILQKSQFEARRRTTLFDALLDAAELFGKDRTMLEDISFAPVSYGVMIRNSLALGRLAGKNTARGDTVGILLPNANATIYLLNGLWATGRTPAMLNFTAGQEAVANACRLAGIQTVFTSRSFVDKGKLHALVASIPARVLFLEDLKPQFTVLDKLWLVLWAQRRPRAVRHKARPSDPAVILFTSGSEGMPKGVVLSHDAILANVEQIAAAFPFGPSDRFLSALPLFHAFGLTAGAAVPLLNGARVLLYPTPLHYRNIPELVYDHDCTVLFSTNTFLGNYAKAAHPYDFYSLRYVVVGAEKLTEDVAKLCFEKFGLLPYEGYGATECAPVIAVNTPYAHRMGTVGELLPGIEARIAPVEGIDEGGVLHVRGANNMLGYLRAPGEIEPVRSEFGEGWYNTGDVVAFDDGFVRLQARMKRFAKIAGEMVSLEAVEKIAATARPNVLHAAVSLRDSSRGETIVVYTEDRALRREDLQAAARAVGAPEVAIPRRVIHLDKLPLLGNGKKDYVTLTRMAAEQTSVRA
jgi:acyl-[acyl-carrier-protein]-phospholipid O-acyltransferase / long-chain-fatty-acid--[acyl-carrier-protein] ligase